MPPPHDAGCLPVTEIAERVRVRGRGGTVLQPGVGLPHRADDFPPGAPVLVITDGWCDVLRVRREHASDSVGRSSAVHRTWAGLSRAVSRKWAGV